MLHLRYISYFILLFILTSCSKIEVKKEYPKTAEQKEEERVGKLTGEGLFLVNSGQSGQSITNSRIKVNSYLWKATLDSISFMPLNSTDSSGGVVITDWCSLNDNSGERYKVNVFILGQELKSDSIKVNVYKQKLSKNGHWEQQTFNNNNNKIADKIKENIIRRARTLKVIAKKNIQ